MTPADSEGASYVCFYQWTDISTIMEDRRFGVLEKCASKAPKPFVYQSSLLMLFFFTFKYAFML